LASGLDCLELRRLRYDLTFTYKLLSNKLHTDKDGNMITSSFPALIDIDVDSLFSFNSYFNTRGHVCKLYKTRCTKSIRQNFLHAGLSIFGILCLTRSASVLRLLSANPLKTLTCQHICDVTGHVSSLAFVFLALDFFMYRLGNC